jgi:predicted transglutaminase-like cysteine proteinase
VAPSFFAVVSLAGAASAQIALPAQPGSTDTSATWPNIDSLLASITPRPEPDLFGFTTVALGRTIYDGIWRETTSRPWPDRQPDLDAFVARIQALPIRERVEQANAWVNARVRFGDDPSLIDHHWGSLAQALARGRGEREDIALAKMQLLAAAGVPRNDLYLVLVSDIQRLRPDALLVVRDEDRVYVLDSKQDAFVDERLVGRYLPTLALGYEGKWIFGHRIGPPTATSVVADHSGRRETGAVPTEALDVRQASYPPLAPQAP